MFAKFGSKKHLGSENRRYANGINHGATVRVNNRGDEATVVASNADSSLVDYGHNREWVENSRLWIKVS